MAGAFLSEGMDKYRETSAKLTLFSNPVYMKDLILHREMDLLILLGLLRGYETLLSGYSCFCVKGVLVVQLELGGDTFTV